MDFLDSFKYALLGLIHILRGERNARIHLGVAVVVLLAGAILGLSTSEMAAIFFAVIIVFLAEIINTALEKTLDLIEKNHNPQIKIIKDMAAGAVLVASVAALVIGIAIFAPYVLELSWRR